MSRARTEDDTVDVVVIGGGPAGSTAATMLARNGWNVLLLERARFPRDHIGESLLPASVPILEELGVLPAVEKAGFLPKWGATMVWGVDPAPWSWYFRETNPSYPHSYQVWRPEFDRILLENSRAAGVDVREGYHVSQVIFQEDAAVGVRFSAEDSGKGTARARFVVDASGQSALLGRALGSRRWDSYFRNLAVYAYFAGARRLPPPDETNIFIESYSEGWFWNIPLHTGLSSVGAVVDGRSGQDGLRSHGADAFLARQIAQAPNVAEMLQGADLVSGPFVARDWSYICDRLAGDGYVMAGDAGCFVDPLFSSGVHLALMSGVLAAAYVTTALKDPGMREPARKVYEELYLKEYNQFREMARLFYSSNRTAGSYFWEARRLLGEEGHTSPRHSFIRAVAGQSPLGYERAVMARGEPPTAFLSGVREAEVEYAARRAKLAALRAAGGDPFVSPHHAVPRLAEGVGVERKPVIGEGEFVWGHVLITPWQPEGTPCSGLVAGLVSLIDGRTSVSELLEKLHGGIGEDQAGRMAWDTIATLEILYLDGAIAELRGPR